MIFVTILLLWHQTIWIEFRTFEIVFRNQFIVEFHLTEVELVTEELLIEFEVNLLSYWV